MDVLASAFTGATAGVGVWLAVQSWRGVTVVPDLTRLVPKAVPSQRAAIWLSMAVVAGLGVWALTGWPVAGAAVGVGVLVGPAALGGTAKRQAEMARAEAIAVWADMIRDTMAGAAGLEESLVQTAQLAPEPIRPELEAFASGLRHRPLDEALAGLAADLAHPSADLLVAALTAAARLEARDLGGLLGRLAEAIRGDVRMRTRVEVGRSRIRTSGRIAVVTTVATVVFLYLFARQLLEPYDQPAGQAWLAVVAAVFFGAGWLLHRYSMLQLPARFTLRTRREDRR